jgi:hypothetical protein
MMKVGRDYDEALLIYNFYNFYNQEQRFACTKLLKSNLFLLNKIKKFLIAPNKLILISMNE